MERQFLGLGNGSDGVLNISTPTTEAPIDSSCSSTAGTDSVSATNTSFSAGQVILIHQSRGTGVGNWELNIIESYTSGTITTVFDTLHTYTDSGASQAQVRVVPQYSQVNISSTYTAKAWDGSIGGILFVMCAGTFTITSAGILEGSAKGFRGGASENPSSYQGEGTVGEGSRSANRNGSGGGGAGGSNSSGAGGGHATSGSIGGGVGGGEEGFSSGSVDLTTMTFGGSGGGSLGIGNPSGGDGGCIIAVFAGEIDNAGIIRVNGETPTNSNSDGGAGAGAGGSVFLKGPKVTNSGTISALAGSGGTANSGPSGGNASVGRIRIETCQYENTGTVSPSPSSVEGGFDFCQSFIHIY